MKKTIFFLFLALSCFLTKGQGYEIPPLSTDTAFHLIQSPSFKYSTRDTSNWIYKGLKGGWSSLVNYKKLKWKLDSLGKTVYIRTKRDSLGITVYTKVNRKDTVNLTVFLQKSDSSFYVTPYRLLLNLPTGFELEVVTGGITQVTLPFTLSNRTLVWYNGEILRSSLWSGIGTQSITLFVDTKEKDLLKIQNQ